MQALAKVVDPLTFSKLYRVVQGVGPPARKQPVGPEAHRTLRQLPRGVMRRFCVPTFMPSKHRVLQFVEVTDDQSPVAQNSRDQGFEVSGGAFAVRLVQCFPGPVADLVERTKKTQPSDRGRPTLPFRREADGIPEVPGRLLVLTRDVRGQKVGVIPHAVIEENLP